MTPAEMKALAGRVLDELWAHGNVGVADEIYAADYVAHNPGAGGPGRAGVQASVQSMRGVFPDLKIIEADYVVEGDKVFTRYVAAGTHRGSMLGEAPTGKTVQMSGMNLSRIANGKVVEGWDEFDMVGIMMQLGMMPGGE